MIDLDLPPLRVGSPTAETLHELLACEPVVVARPELDWSPVRSAALVLAHLSQLCPDPHSKRLAWASGRSMTGYEAADELFRHLGSFGVDGAVVMRDTFSQASLGPNAVDLNGQRPLKVSFHRSRPTYDVFPSCDLLVIELGRTPELANPDRRFRSIAGQVLLIGTEVNPEPVTPKLRRAARGQIPGFWGDIPAHIALAGMPA